MVAVHTESDATYARIGRDCPDGYVDPDIGRWAELETELAGHSKS